MTKGVENNQLAQLEALFEQLNIDAVKYEHPPLQTCQDADRLSLNRIGTRIKNLFLRDNYGKQHFLLLVPADYQVDLKALSKQQQLSRLGFASSQRLEKYLGVKPGCVSALAVLNDSDQAVNVWIESSLWQAEHFQCHPFFNDKTWVLNKADLLRFFEHTGHVPQVIDVPCL
ncbi:prolyl-tRNA synthetase associated domain-containing protein [Pseudoalteromonas phenolica]|uniref:prolyl-tRNA synthetase associated domain-containing protein n=1 Tax=Pseudoalteromonas phenolica TaxID=161398 RepID=UPI00384ED7BF